MLNATSSFLKSLGVTRPAVVIDEARARANIAAMAARAARAGVRFRPHFKTHQSGPVGRWFADEGVTAITVSSLAMAEAFADFGWRDITLAILVNPLELPRITELAGFLVRKGGRLGLTVDSAAVAAQVSAACADPVDVWLKLDTGYGRTGVRWDGTRRLQAVVDAVAAPARVAGLLTHAGHSYHATGHGDLAGIWRETVTRLDGARRAIERPDLDISSGDTPCCGAVDDLAGVDELRPGNFVFHDLMQMRLGACAAANLAAAVACPVLGIYPERGQLVIHGGAVHLSKESLPGSDGTTIHGCLGTVIEREGQPALNRVLDAAPVVSVSQEHGVIDLGDEFDAGCRDLAVGDLVLIWPVHACLTCNLHREYITLSGDRLAKF